MVVWDLVQGWEEGTWICMKLVKRWGVRNLTLVLPSSVTQFTKGWLPSPHKLENWNTESRYAYLVS